MIFSVVALMCLGCTNREQEKAQVEEAARGYLEAVGNYRFDEAVPYSSRQTVEKTLDVFNRLMKFTDTAYVNSNTPAEITITGAKVLSSNTAVAYYHKHTPITEQDDSVTVVKEEGRWLVDDRVQEPVILNYLEGHPTVVNLADTVGK